MVHLTGDDVMEPIYAKCGHRCDWCPAFEGNLKGEEDKRRMCEAFKKYYGYEITPDMVEACPGCQAVTEPPDKDCPEWHCAKEKGVETCAHCEEFICDTCRQRMDAMDACLQKFEEIPDEDYELYAKPFLGKEHLTKIRRQLEQQD